MIGRGLVIGGALYALTVGGLAWLAFYAVEFAVLFGLVCAAHRARYRGVR